MSNSKPKIIDLFAGVGGLSLGAVRAGYEVALAVEFDKHAITSHAINFPSTIHWEKDLSSVTGTELLSRANLSGVEGIIGGPPCQGFSTIGRRDVDDPRNRLYRHFYQIVSEVRPEFFIAENVPGILSDLNRPILESALDLVRDHYEIIGPIKIKASDFGAPTTRTRVFVIGIKNNVQNIAMGPNSFQSKTIIPPTTVDMALYGLPEYVDSNWQESGYDKWEKLALRGKGWFYSKLYGEIPNGVGDLQSIRRLEKENEVSGCIGTLHMEHVVDRFRNVPPGKKDVISKASRLHPKGFCPTLRAGTGSDRGSYQAVRPLHPTQPRVITPREAARLQGFPDWFQFHPTKWHSFRQIGNSVCPIVAEAVLTSLN
ncbi:DNA cytosine methyltransferase [Marinobacter salarius]|uniref:DNA cytosine methyltransferase n=1 Tax=Marinobacter salarius TaxID=1420917 RepID=UPI00300872CE